MLFFPSLFRSRSAIRSRDLPPISPRCARDTNLRLVAQHRVDLDDSRGGRGWLLIVSCRFSGVFCRPRIFGGGRGVARVGGGAGAVRRGGGAPLPVRGVGGGGRGGRRGRAH